MASEQHLVQALYDYDPVDTKVLACRTNEKFIIIKSSSEWLYVVNTNGALGYIPANYVEPITIDDQEFLTIIDSVIGILDAKHNESSVVTVRQINHAQVKLTQIRCQVVQRIFQGNAPSLNMYLNTGATVVQENELIANTVTEVEETKLNDVGVQTDLTDIDLIGKANENEQQQQQSQPQQEQQTEVKQEKNNNNNSSSEKEEISIDVTATIIERLRISTELSHDMCKIAADTVIRCLRDNIPSMRNKCDQLLLQLNDIDKYRSVNASTAIIGAHTGSSDLINMRNTFKKLWYCKNDDQQRSWPVHEDEDIIGNYLNELCKLFINANPLISKEIIKQNNYDNVHMLVTYFQMETRKNLRLKLYKIFNEIIRLHQKIIPDYFLNSVLPTTLANEMISYFTDVERFTNASSLFTAIFSTGHKPPVNIYEQINEHFLEKLLKLIEEEDFDGNKLEQTCNKSNGNGLNVENQLQPEMIIPSILSFNLHFDDLETNYLLKALKTRDNASQLTEILVSHFNWEEDPTRLTNTIEKPENSLDLQRQNAVHKLLREIFENESTAKLFYYNDVRVVIDIIVTYLNNLLSGDKSRCSYLEIAKNIVKQASYQDEPHKLDELTLCLNFIENDENSSKEEIELVNQIKNILSKMKK